MALNRTAASTAWSRAVATKKELPIDANPHERVVVREDENIYEFDPSAKTWTVVGTFAKTGGKSLAEIAAHIDIDANPHETTLAEVYAQDAVVEITDVKGAIKLIGTSASELLTLLRLIQKGKGGALKIGEDVGNSNALVWINAGLSKGSVIKVVEPQKGATLFEIDSDGNLLATSAAFKKGLKGALLLESLLGSDGKTLDVSAADATLPDGDGAELLLGGGRSRGKGAPGGVSVQVSARGPDGNNLNAKLRAARFTATGLGLGTLEPKERLDVDGNIRLTGSIDGDLVPKTKDRALGTKDKRWASAALGALDLQGAEDATLLALRANPKQSKPLIKVSSASGDGDIFSLDALGMLSTGAIKIKSALSVGSFLIEDTASGAVLGHDTWKILPGHSKRDCTEVLRRSEDGNWTSILKVTQSGLGIGGDLKVAGAVYANELRTNSVIGSDGGIISVHGEGNGYNARTHVFTGEWNTDNNTDGLSVNISDRKSGALSCILKLMLNGESLLALRKDGTLVPGKGQSVGSADAPWAHAFVSDLTVGTLVLNQDGIATLSSDLGLAPGSGTVTLPQKLKFTGDVGEIRVGVGESLILGDDKHGVAFDFAEVIRFDLGGGQLVNASGIKLYSGGPTLLDLKQQASGAFRSIVLDVEGKTGTLMDLRLNGQSCLKVADDGVSVGGTFNVMGLAFQKLEGEVSLSGLKAQTPFVIPAGVLILSVTATVVEDIEGVRFIQLGDSVTADRFSGATTGLTAGSIIKGMNQHRGHAAQLSDAPIVVTTDAPATAGKLKVTAFVLNPTG